MAAKARGILMVVPALVAFCPPFLLCLRPLAMVGVVVPAGWTAEALVAFAFMQGKRVRAGQDFKALVALEVVGERLVLWQHWCLVA